MNDIFNQFDHLTTLSSDIAAASIEQSRGISEINTALSQLDAITQQNIALAEEIANSATHLRDLAASMELSVRSWVVKVEKEHPSGDEKKNGAIVP